MPNGSNANKIPENAYTHRKFYQKGKKMKRTQRMAAVLLFCLLALSLWIPFPTYADMGPKPSVRVNFQNLGDEPCYATLLASEPSYMPWHAWEEGEDTDYFGSDPAVWQAFVEYEDADGYYFLQYAKQVNEQKTFAWTYYPPKNFKLLLYFPETDTFLVSGCYQKYAFDSVYTVDLSARDDGLLVLERGEKVKSQDLLFFGIRVVLTIAIEMVVAVIFGFRRRGQIVFLVILNILTQVFLNLILLAVGTDGGSFVVIKQMLVYFLLEIVVFLVEAVADAIFLRRLSEPKRTRSYCVLYAFAANAASFMAGEILVFLLPAIF